MPRSHQEAMDSDYRRARALIRDEGRLRSVYAKYENQRSDLEVAGLVRDRAEDLLETVSAVAQDEEFWQKLHNGVPSRIQLERIAQLDTGAFAVLLEAAGYSSPPPPAVEVLVEEMRDALEAAAKDSFSDADAANRIRSARRSLTILTMRARHQIPRNRPLGVEESGLHSAAASLGKAARRLIPPAVGVGAGALVEMHLPGTGAGLAIGKMLQNVFGNGIELAAATVIGNPGPTSDIKPDPVDDERLKGMNPLRVHMAALADNLGTLKSLLGEAPSDHGLKFLRETWRHMQRINELLEDWEEDPQDYSGAYSAMEQRLSEISRLLDYPPSARYIERSARYDLLAETERAADNLRLALSASPRWGRARPDIQERNGPGRDKQ
jgi:hypothetical protein